MNLKNLSTRVKTVAVSGMILLGVLLSPFVGKGVENTTKALFPGLSAEEQIVTVADVVDSNKVESEAKVAELQSIIDAKQVKLAEQQKLIDEQKSVSQVVQAKINNESECRKLYSENSYCSSDNYFGKKSAFDNYIDKMEENFKYVIERCKESGKSKEKCESSNKLDYDSLNAKFEKCQGIIAKCG